MKVGIIGLGLIGGSLGIDLRRLGHYVWGVSRNPATCATALTLGAVDEAAPHLDHLTSLPNTDIVVVCTPIAQVVETVRQLTPWVAPPTVITDVASVKGAIVPPAQAIYDHFVGGHPMAGTAGQGITSAQPDLFRGRVCVLCEGKGLAQVQYLWEQVGMTTLICSPTDHDQAVAWISHLPVLLSASLINSVHQEPDPHIQALAHRLASTGFRDTSRVGGGNPELGQLMAEYNRTALLSALSIYQQELARVRDWLVQHQWAELRAFLHHAHHDRQQFDSCR